MIAPSVAPFGYKMQADDTAYEIERLMIDAWRAMSPAEKARLFRDACRAVDQLAQAGVRVRFPDAPEREVRLRVAAMRLGPDLMREVYGWNPER
jgi:hypothetical protein